MNKFKQRNNNDIDSLFKILFKVIKKLEYHKLFGQIKKDEKIMENYLNKNKNREVNSKEKEKGVRKNKKKVEQYIDKCIQTEVLEENKKGNEKISRNKRYF